MPPAPAGTILDSFCDPSGTVQREGFVTPGGKPRTPSGSVVSRSGRDFCGPSVAASRRGGFDARGSPEVALSLPGTAERVDIGLTGRRGLNISRSPVVSRGQQKDARRSREETEQLPGTLERQIPPPRRSNGGAANIALPKGDNLHQR